MIEALINSLSKLLERKGDSVILNLEHNNCQKIRGVHDESPDFEGKLSSNSSSDDNAHITNVSVSEVCFPLKKIV